MAITLIHQFLLVILLPTWLLVGLTDWWCHRKSSIETTSGARESILHLALSLEAAVAILSAMVLEINALVLVIVGVSFIAHEITTNVDIHIALPQRLFTTTEQRVHDFLTAIPFAGVLLLFATHTDQAQAILGFGDTAADWKLRLKTEPLPLSYLVTWNIAALALNVGPYVEELIRCLRMNKSSVRPLS